MKLYTREQMIEAFNYGKTLEGFDWIGDMIDSLEALELPSDEEIIAAGQEQILYNISKRNWWILGAVWLKDKIKGGNK
jgi:hypothetical protein